MAVESEQFAEFMAARWAALFRTAYLLTGDTRRAEDVTQQALANTFARRSKVRDVGALEAYVRRALTNLVISESRRSARRSERLTADPPEAPHPAPTETDNAATSLDLDSALARLSRQQRAVVVLRFYDDQSVAEVANTLGCSEGNVKRVTHDALTRLRTMVPVDPDTDLLGEGSRR